MHITFLLLDLELGVSDPPYLSGIVKKNSNANCVNRVEVLHYFRMDLGWSTMDHSFLCISVKFHSGVCSLIPSTFSYTPGHRGTLGMLHRVHLNYRVILSAKCSFLLRQVSTMNARQ